jgi:hypothetical protein
MFALFFHWLTKYFGHTATPTEHGLLCVADHYRERSFDLNTGYWHVRSLYSAELIPITVIERSQGDLRYLFKGKHSWITRNHLYTFIPILDLENFHHLQHQAEVYGTTTLVGTSWIELTERASKHYILGESSMILLTFLS